MSTTMWRLRPRTFLPASYPRGPLFRGLHRLAVDDGGAGCCLPSFGPSDQGTQCLLNPLPGSLTAPFPKVPPNRAPRGQVMGHHAPGYATTQHVQYAVYNFPQVHGARMSPRCIWGNKGANWPHCASLKSLGYAFCFIPPRARLCAITCTASQRGGDQRQHLVPPVGPPWLAAEVKVMVDEFPQAQVPGGCQWEVACGWLFT